VPTGYRHPLIPTRTSQPRFRAASANRCSDLSAKRNIGLLMARLQGWGKVLFLDDDIRDPTAGAPLSLPLRTVGRLALSLASHQVAGLVCDDFPDNSVFCHARRLAGLPQDTFVTGGALGVNCDDRPLPFFPDIYNEDWFFSSGSAARRDVARVGRATQAPYDPFADPQRACIEEFGDLLAEGLFARFGTQPEEMDYDDRIADADLAYWERFIHARRTDLEMLRRRLSRRMRLRIGDTRRQRAAIDSLAAAAHQQSSLTPRLCVEFLDAWIHDLHDWQQATQSLGGAGDAQEALGRLGLTTARQVGPAPDRRERPPTLSRAS
jgi:hypothetical protein